MVKKFKYYLIYKPFQVISQFSESDGKQTLKSIYNFPKDVYPIGRLDYDSEGLLIITNDNLLKTKLLNPDSLIKKTYYVQIEGIPTQEQIDNLENGVIIKLKEEKYHTKPATVQIINPPILPERIPPIRFRKNIPTTWLSITITEGKNRQIRKMTAAVNLPTLRLVRFAIGDLTLNHLKNSQIAFMSMKSIYKLTLKS